MTKTTTRKTAAAKPLARTPKTTAVATKRKPGRPSAKDIADRAEAQALAAIVVAQAVPIISAAKAERIKRGAKPAAVIEQTTPATALPDARADRVISMAEFRTTNSGPGSTVIENGEEVTEVTETAEQLQERLERKVDAPTIEALPALETLTVGIKSLQAALLVAATKDVRTYLNTVLIHREGSAVRLVTTDGHRLLVQDIRPEEAPAWLTAEGVKLSAPELASALSVCSKHGEDVTIEWGVGHSHAIVQAADRFCSFRIWTVEGKFPDYVRIMAGVDLSNQGGDALAAAQLDPAFVKGAADVAKVLGCKTMQSFTGDESKASAFLFAGADAVMVVMPVRGDGMSTRLVTARTVAIVGGGMASSVGALRAHLTRTTNEIATTTDEGQLAKLNERRAGLVDRIESILRMSREALPAPAKAA